MVVSRQESPKSSILESLFINGKFDVINLFSIEDSELYVDVWNIIHHKEIVLDVDDDVNVDVYVDDSATDYSFHGSDEGFDYDFEKLEDFAKASRSARELRIILENLEDCFTNDYKKLVCYAYALKESNFGSDVLLKNCCSRRPLATVGDVEQNS
ncbi:hypothetical protein HAX54_013745, partial [Datura stramonium]|nr:hypothetical protein [Datura stramonium]